MTSGGAKISCLHCGDNAILGILHFPNASADKILESRAKIPIEIVIKITGRYAIEIYKDGILDSSEKATLIAFKGRPVTINLSNKACAFIKIKMLD